MDNKELRQIAIDIYEGRIFTNRHCSGDEAKHVFMVIGLGGFKDMTKEKIENIGLIYEYMSEQGPRSWNGKPMFMSCRTLTKAETEKMFKFFEEYKAMKQEFMH